MLVGLPTFNCDLHNNIKRIGFMSVCLRHLCRKQSYQKPVPLLGFILIIIFNHSDSAGEPLADIQHTLVAR